MPDRDLLDRINRLEATVNELSRAHGAPISAVRDVNGTPLVQTDPVTGVGLQRPYIPLPFQTVHWMDWPRTVGVPTEVAPWTLWRCQTVKQHPAIIMTIGGITTEATTGRARVMLNGAQVWPDIPFVTGIEQWVRVGPIPVPGEFLSPITLSIQAVLDTTMDGNSAILCSVQEAYGCELRDAFPLPT